MIREGCPLQCEISKSKMVPVWGLRSLTVFDILTELGEEDKIGYIDEDGERVDNNGGFGLVAFF